MFRHVRITMILAMMLIASVAVAEGEENLSGTLLNGVSLTCSTSAPSLVTGCFAERPAATFGNIEFSVGLDVQGDLGSFLKYMTSGSDESLEHFLEDSHIAPYGILAYYGEGKSFWAELRIPRLGGIPVLGASEWLRVGFTIHFN